METPEDRKRRLARERQQRRRQRLQGEKVPTLGRCLVCERVFLQRERKGPPKQFCSRACIDRNRYLQQKHLGSDGRCIGTVILLKLGRADEQTKRLFGFMHPDIAGNEEATRAWNEQLVRWQLCSDLSREEYSERVRRLYAATQGIWL
jgi:hypothetical protein